MWVFIAQLVEYCSANAEATGSNPVEAPKIFFFFGLIRNCLNCDYSLQLRGSIFISFCESLLSVFSCSSQIGKRVGKQAVYLGSGCEYKGTVLHELIHLLGFYHEHNRADRDTYLRIHEENIDPSMLTCCYT